MLLRGWLWVQEPDGLGEETPPESLCFCHQAAEALTRWQPSEKTVTRVIWVFDDLTALVIACTCTFWSRVAFLVAFSPVLKNHQAQFLNFFIIASKPARTVCSAASGPFSLDISFPHESCQEPMSISIFSCCYVKLFPQNWLHGFASNTATSRLKHPFDVSLIWNISSRS